MGSTGSGTALCIMVACCNWCISIRLLFPCTMVSSGVLWFAVRHWLWCFLIGRHLRFRYFGSVVPVYVVWVKSYVNCLFRFPCVPMVVSVYKLYFVSQRLVSGSVSMFWNRGILSACESYIPVVFFHAFLHGSSRFSGVDFTACAWYLVDYAILLVWVSGIFWSDQPRS